MAVTSPPGEKTRETTTDLRCDGQKALAFETIRAELAGKPVIISAACLFSAGGLEFWRFGGDLSAAGEVSRRHSVRSLSLGNQVVGGVHADSG